MARIVAKHITYLNNRVALATLVIDISITTLGLKTPSMKEPSTNFLHAQRRHLPPGDFRFN
jgi:hypothetical protein